MPTDILDTQTSAAGSAAVVRGVAALAEGGVVAFPTETVYGLAVRADRPEAVARLRALRGVPDARFAVHVVDAGSAIVFAGLGACHGVARRFLHKAMPGPVTAVTAVPAAVVARQRRAGDAVDAVFEDGGQAGEVRVSLRCPADWWAQRLLVEAGATVIAGAAVKSNGRSAVEAGEVVGADLVLDGGRSRYGRGSTRVLLRADGSAEGAVTTLAEGVYDGRTVERLARFNLLLVCTGNTCRSPMAEAIARELLAGREGVSVSSAGVSAYDGAPASAEAVAVLARLGLDLSKHRSRSVSLAQLREADLVLTMTASHREAVLALAPDLADRVETLDPAGDVPDPIGGSEELYRRTAARVRSALEAKLTERVA